jgi:drug/metabolite transporter (DMT)-like permease
MKFKDSFHPYAMVTILFWSLAYVFTRLTLQYFSAFSLGFLRYFIASCALLFVVVCLKLQPPRKKEIPWFFAAGGVGFFLYMIAFNQGQAVVTATTGSIVIATVPVITALLARFVYQEHLTKIQWVAIFLEFAGAAVLTLMHSTFSLNHGVLWLLLAAGVGVSLYGFYQACFPERYSDVWTDTDLFSAITFRVYSTLANPNVLGEYLLLMIPIACSMLFSADSRKERILCLLAAGIMGVCLILTYSRGCYLGLLFAAAVFLVLLDRRFLFLGILAVALCPLYLPDSVINRFASIGNMADSSTSYRVRIWLGSLAMLKDFGFSGVGFGSEAFNTIYPSYAMHSVSAQHAHNLYLQILCDSGIVGLLVFLGLLVSFCRMMLTAIRHEQNARARILQIGGISAVGGFLVQSLTDYTFYNYRVMLLFFGMLGLCVLFTRMGSQEARV